MTRWDIACVIPEGILVMASSQTRIGYNPKGNIGKRGEVVKKKKKKVRKNGGVL